MHFRHDFYTTSPQTIRELKLKSEEKLNNSFAGISVQAFTLRAGCTFNWKITIWEGVTKITITTRKLNELRWNFVGQIDTSSSLCLPHLKKIHAKLKKLLKNLRGLLFWVKLYLAQTRPKWSYVIETRPSAQSNTGMTVNPFMATAPKSTRNIWLFLGPIHHKKTCSNYYFAH